MKSNDDPTYMKKLTIVSNDDTANTILVVFPGAASGIYTFKVSGAIGSLNCTSDIVFIETLLEVTEFQPRSGSTLGGTLVTITGKHFGIVATDNPVKIGNNYCYV